MKLIQKYAGVLAVVALAVAIIGVFTPAGKAVFGGTTNYDALKVSKLTVGASGSGFGTILYGTCYLKGDSTITATTTGMVDCVSSSFAVGDYVTILGLATSTTELAKQISIVGIGAASTTAGFAPVRVTNLSGADLVPSSKNGLGSSTPFIIYRPLSTTPGL